MMIKNSQKDSIAFFETRENQKTPKSKKSFSDYLKYLNLNVFLLEQVTEEEINSIILKLNTKKAVGPNSIPKKILKDALRKKCLNFN